jgi:uncharacterized protein YndB with AHSA1/START domain
MNVAALKSHTQDIVVEDVFPHSPEMIWKTLTSGALMRRWLQMPSTGFEAVKGKHFTFQTTPAGAWDGVIRCEVLEVVPNQRFVFSWQGGDDGNEGYGSRLDTTVTFTLAKADGGTKLRLVHAGFVTPKNDGAYKNMSGGWKKVVPQIGAISGEQN